MVSASLSFFFSVVKVAPQERAAAGSERSGSKDANAVLRGCRGGCRQGGASSISGCWLLPIMARGISSRRGKPRSTPYYRSTPAYRLQQQSGATSDQWPGKGRESANRAYEYTGWKTEKKRKTKNAHQLALYSTLRERVSLRRARVTRNA